MTKTTQWQTRDGRQVICSISVDCSVYTHESRLDGELVSTTRRPSTTTEIVITIDGKVMGRGDSLSTWLPKGSPSGYNRTLGKMAIPTDQTVIIEQSIIDLTASAQLSATDEYRQLESQRLATIESNKQIAMRNELEMSELYAERRANGYCYKCSSYCHGDCSSN